MGLSINSFVPSLSISWAGDARPERLLSLFSFSPLLTVDGDPSCCCGSMSEMHRATDLSPIAALAPLLELQASIVSWSDDFVGVDAQLLLLASPLATADDFYWCVHLFSIYLRWWSLEFWCCSVGCCTSDSCWSWTLFTMLVLMPFD